MLRPDFVIETRTDGAASGTLGVLRDIGRRFDGTLALNAAILAPGHVRVGDRAEVVDPEPEHRQLLEEAGLLVR